MRKPSRLKRAWWAATDDRVLGMAGVIATGAVIVAGTAVWFLGSYKPVRSFLGDESCRIEWDGRTNPIVCD